MIDLNMIWFFLVGVLLIGYAILDGFDLGVGALHLFTRTDAERRTLIKSIGPVWDGNEVWLVTAGGALFAAFPHAYATAFSGFYLAFITLLLALIFRAVALEVRNKETWKWWRSLWDYSFAISSIIASVLFGTAVGNLAAGMAIGADMEYKGTFFDLVQPYQLMVGLFVLATFAMHGSIYLYLKTEGALQAKVKGWIYKTFTIFVVMYIITTAVTIIYRPVMIQNFGAFWWAWIIALLSLMAVANIPRALYLNLPFRAFVSSSCVIAGLVFLFGIGLYPNMIPTTLDDGISLTIYNAASSQKTLFIMLIIAVIGMPLVVTYTVSIYYIFRGKVKLESEGY